MKYHNLKTTYVYDAYWEFATKRQAIFWKRVQDKEYPWTEDPILNKYKFTNAYRVEDRVSQFLIKNIIYSKDYYKPEDQCFRILLFKLFNKIETWEYLSRALGEDITYSSYDYRVYDDLLTQKLNDDETIYSAAYIMPSGKTCFGFDRKHQNNLKLLEYMMKTSLPAKIANAKSLKELYELLLSYPTLGSFLAFQFAIDINYSELCDFSEMSFVVAGPGAKSGIHKCFGELTDYTYEDIIRYVADRQEEEFEKRGLRFGYLYGRKLQLIDCQNLFCEIDKYARVKYSQIQGINDRQRIKQQYVNRNLEKINYFFPPKWGIGQMH